MLTMYRQAALCLSCIGLSACVITGTFATEGDSMSSTATDDSTSTSESLPRCGDGVAEGDEECDDGNQDDLDGCLVSCEKVLCGDELIRGGEECDDGNSNNDDGCSNCLWSCDSNPECEGHENLENCPGQCDICGNGESTTTEACDCGSTLDALGEACTAPNQTYWPTIPPADACSETCDLKGTDLPHCGDGIVNGPGDSEECDAGADNSDIGACTTMCKLAICGDGLIQSGAEQCDNGINNNDDAAACTEKCASAFCGDGLVQTGVEECDGDVEDCFNCFLPRRVFATAASYCGDMSVNTVNCGNSPLSDEIKGAERGDERCRQTASAAKIASSATMKAWLSASEDPLSRFNAASARKKFGGKYIMIPTDGVSKEVARGWEGLVSGMLSNPITVSENGEAIKGLAWTNTTAMGMGGADSCNQWSDTSASLSSTHGFMESVDDKWSASQAVSSCSLALHLYCFEDPL